MDARHNHDSIVRKKIFFYTLMFTITFVIILVFLNFFMLKLLDRDPEYIVQRGYINIKRALTGKFPDLLKGKKRRNEYRIMVPVPYTVANMLPNVRRKDVTTNDLGFRGTLNYQEQIALAKSIHNKGGKVVVFLGGSAAFGCDSSSDETSIVGYLNRIAKEENLSITTFNFGMGSYTSTQELACLIFYALDLEPDLVVVYDGFNDMVRVVSKKFYNVGVKIPFAFPRIRKSYPQQYSSVFLDRKYNNNDDEVDQKALKEVLDNYEKNLSIMVKIMETYGKKTLLTVQPYRGFRNGLNPQEKENSIYEEFIKRAKKIAREEIKAEYIETTDLLEDKKNVDDYFDDAVHMKDLGYGLVAKKLFPTITSMLE